MDHMQRRGFLGTLASGSTALTGAGAVSSPAAPAEDPEQPRPTFTSDRPDGRFVDTAGFLHATLKHRQPQLAFTTDIPANGFTDWQQQVRKKLKELMCFPQHIPPQPPPRLISSEPRDGYQLQRWEAFPEPYSVVPFLMLVPDGATPASPAPAVMCFPGSTHSKESLAGEPELDTGQPLDWKHFRSNRQALHYVRRGFISVAMDNPATCELASPLRARSHMSTVAQWMGRNYLGLSVFQKSVVLQWLSKQPYVDNTRIAASGHSLGSNPADILGVLYPDQISAVVHNDFVCNWQEQYVCVNLRPAGEHHTVFGLFEWFDHTDLEAALAPCPLLFTEGGRTNQIEKIRQAYALAGAPAHVQVYHYDKYATPDKRSLDGLPLPDGLTSEEYLEYANVDAPMHRFRPHHAVPWLAGQFGM